MPISTFAQVFGADTIGIVLKTNTVTHNGINCGFATLANCARQINYAAIHLSPRDTFNMGGVPFTLTN
jgi:hypothetical protein